MKLDGSQRIGGADATLTSDELAALEAMAGDPELSASLAAVAHLIHGSTEGRFTVTHAPGPGVSRAEIEGVGFRYLPLEEALAEKVDIPNPGLGLWRA